jgi:biotin carboxyl carrier protein
LAKAHLAELRALVNLAVTEYSRAISDRHQDQQQTDAVARALAKAARFSSIHELAFHLTNNLKNKMGGNQVALGIVTRRTVQLVSVSGLDRIHARSPGTLRIRQAMEECLDMGQPTVYQHDQLWSEANDAPQYRLHQRWHHETGCAVASIPVFDGNDCVAVVSIQRDEAEPFDTEELTKTAARLAPYGAAIRLVQRASESLAARAGRQARQRLSTICSRGAWGRKASAAALVLGLLWFAWGTIPYTICVPSVVTARQLHHFSAPFEGRIAACHVIAGDHVQAGQTLLEMDTEDLRLQADRLRADIGAARLEVARAFGQSHAAGAAQANARLAALQARLKITRNRIAKACVIAPCDGRIISGDLSRQVGETVPMGHPLLQLAPRGAQGIELRIPEQLVVELGPGHQGQFTSNARPDTPIGCRIQSVHASSALVDGQKTFVAEADLNGGSEWTLVGMEGIARIEVGRRRVWWVALHRLIDTVRLQLGV